MYVITDMCGGRCLHGLIGSLPMPMLEFVGLLSFNDTGIATIVLAASIRPPVPRMLGAARIIRSFLEHDFLQQSIYDVRYLLVLDR